ncbi:hypothetical protein DRQ26_07185 [bacterium]|nr:MAG: hypothetical protein DRQ26_07185 [bacterium]
MNNFNPSSMSIMAFFVWAVAPFIYSIGCVMDGVRTPYILLFTSVWVIGWSIPFVYFNSDAEVNE